MHIEFENVKKYRENFTLSIPNIHIEQGEVLGVIGNNGAGKSTMIQLLLDLVNPAEGVILRYRDGELEKSLKEWKKEVGFVFDDLSIYDDMHMSLLSSFLSGVYPTWDEDYFFSLLNHFEVDKKKKVKKFSRGMRMKAGIAVALAHRPQLLILDEPNSGLDTKSRKQVISLLKKENIDSGTTIIFSSHILSDMEQLATSVWLMDKGEVLIHGNVEELEKNHSVSEDGTVYATAEDGVRKATLEDLHDYYLGRDMNDEFN